MSRDEELAREIIEAAKRCPSKGNWATYEQFKSQLQANGLLGYESQLAAALKV